MMEIEHVIFIKAPGRNQKGFCNDLSSDTPYIMCLFPTLPDEATLGGICPRF
jgi:hypothetical protein